MRLVAISEASLKPFTFFLFIFILLTVIVPAQACTLKMGYRTNERAPLINAAPDSSGLYVELYKVAAEKIGCDLVVIRAPKKRLLKELREGELDFYPGFNFTQERAKYIFYIENGLPGGDIGASRLDFPTITQLEQLKGHTLLKASGGPDFLNGIGGVIVHAKPEMTIRDAMEFLDKKRGDFFIYNKASMEYQLKIDGNTNVKLHPDCCGGILPSYLGFSRFSSHYIERPNPEYINAKPIAIGNRPIMLSPESTTYKLEKALKEMKLNGETDNLYQKYHH